MTHALPLTTGRTSRPTQFGIVGFLSGGLWWPIGAEAVKEVRFTWSAGEYDSLREAVDALMVREDGDFSTAARLTADTYLYAERGDVHTTHTHRVDVGQFPSISDYVSDGFGFDAIYGDEA
jgi:hypothetical protein